MSRGEPGPTLRRILRENGLSIVLAALFLLFVGGQIVAGHHAYNDELVSHGALPMTLFAYLGSGDFLEALFENWESEFLQMAMFVVLAEKLRQKGSAESKRLEGEDETDEDPESHRHDPKAPWPVRRGGVWLKVYEHSLFLAFALMFLASLALHALGGLKKVNAEHALHGEAPTTLAAYVRSPRFWFESFQNWQSELLAILCIVVLTIFLRERGSPQSKPVYAPHSETGK
jgi:hypothetical protein